MKKIFLFLFIVLSLADTNITNVYKILEKVPKNSPEYSLDLTLIKEIKSLKPEKVKINFYIKNEFDYIKIFNKLVMLKVKLKKIDKRITELQNKLSILSSKKDPTSKLQYIYYQKLLKIQQDLKLMIINNFSDYEKKLLEKMKIINFNISVAKENIKKLEKILKKYKLKIDDLNINLQKWQILNNSEKIKEIKLKIDYINSKIKNLYYKLINNYEILWFYDLKNKNKEAFNVDNNIVHYAKLINDNLYYAYKSIISDFENKVFGSKIFVYGAERGVNYTLQKIWSILNYPLFKVGNRTITPINFFLFILVLILGWFIGKYYKRLIYKIKVRYKFSYATETLLANMGYYAILVISFLIALKTVGLDLSSLAIIAGALSVGIGFGLQNIVSNFVSGIILMFERSIKVGDYIQIDENTRGEVIDISMRSTIIRTNDNIDIIVPNQDFIQNNVINWTMKDDIVRFRVPFGVEYGSNIDEVEKIVLDALKKSKIPYVKQNIKYNVEPRVIFLEMGDSSLNFELNVWVEGEYAKRPRRTKSEFLKMIYDALNKAGIGIPFPQQDLHIKDSIPFEVRIKRDNGKMGG